MPRVEEITLALARRGFRETESRRLIAQALARRTSAFTAQDLYAELAPQGVGRATIFRTLNLLLELGMLNRLHVGAACDSYMLCEPSHHHHLVCLQCGSVYPFDECSVTEDAQRVATDVGFRIEGHNLEVFGRCANCLRS
jgi:Fur family ferric uptake transcriptional regulator